MKLPTNINFQDLKNHRWAKKIQKMANSSFLAKIIIAVALWMIALIPFWLYLIIRWIAGPADFWQEALIIIVCMVVIGWLQALMAIGAAFITLAIMLDDSI